MKVLVACEFSGRVREAFAAQGHDAWSCDLLPTDMPGKHIQDNVLNILNNGWDIMIAFPPCTHLASSGARWFPEKRKDGRQQAGIDFFMRLIDAPVRQIAVENPIGIMSTRYRKPDQIIQPWQFGHGETKATCLWLKNLPLLQPTNIVSGRVGRVHREPPAPDRWKKRSITYQGIADAMAQQWTKNRPKLPLPKDKHHLESTLPRPRMEDHHMEDTLTKMEETENRFLWGPSTARQQDHDEWVWEHYNHRVCKKCKKEFVPPEEIDKHLSKYARQFCPHCRTTYRRKPK